MPGVYCPVLVELGADGSRTGELVHEFDAKFFDDRVRQNVAGDGVNFLLRLVARDTLGEPQFEELALPNVRDIRVTEPVESGANGLTLRVEDGGLQHDENTSFHGKYDYLMRTAPNVLF